MDRLGYECTGSGPVRMQSNMTGSRGLESGWDDVTLDRHPRLAHKKTLKILFDHRQAIHKVDSPSIFFVKVKFDKIIRNCPYRNNILAS